jgi:hypothetical protein
LFDITQVELLFLSELDGFFTFDPVGVRIDARQEHCGNPRQQAYRETQEESISDLLDWLARKLIRDCRQGYTVDIRANARNTESYSERE